MTFSELRHSCLQKKGARETFPFDEKTLVFKVMDKMFALVGLDDDPPEVNLKCDPEFAEVLRAKYDAVRPGYHMNKRHWNTVTLDGTIPDADIQMMIDESYQQVVRKLKKSDRQKLAEL